MLRLKHILFFIVTFLAVDFGLSIESLIPENVRYSLKLDAKVCDSLFWNYLSTLQTKLDMNMLNEADENIMDFVRKLVKEKKEMLMKFYLIFNQF